MNLDPEQREHLIQEAINVRHWAYTPYSHYQVGAALLASSGKFYSGVNVENAAYPSSICAERTAIFKAISEGEREVIAIAVVTENGGTPCGACRQVLSEFGKGAEVIIVDGSGNVLSETTVDRLLPDAFGPEKLK